MADGSATPEIKVDPAAVTALGRNLRAKFLQYVKDRRLIEEQWMKNIRQYLGKWDPQLESTFDAGQSRAYPKVTRVKCVSMQSRLASLLFPADEKNWSLEPSPSPNLPPEAMQAAINQWVQASNGQPDLADFDKAMQNFAATSAAKMEQQIDDQMADMGAYGPSDYQSLVRQVLRSAIIYGPGIIKGPMSITETRTVPQRNPMTQQWEVGQQTVYRPIFEFVSNWDYYPDLSAKDFSQMDGQFQRHIFSRHQLIELAKRPDFKGDVIRKYLSERQTGNYARQVYEIELQVLGEQVNVNPDTRKYEVIEYWGYVSALELSAAGVELPEDKLSSELKATVWMLDDVVIKAAEDPFPEGASMYHQFIFEQDDVNLMGTGLPEIMRDSQMAISMSSRMLMDNASVACGPNVMVDYDRLVPGQDMTIKPFKTWLTEPGTGAGMPDPVKSLKFDANIIELQAMIKMYQEFADQETFVNPATGGDSDGMGEALRTTGNMSMVLGNAALPFKDIVRSFDRFTVSVIHSLVEWNMALNPRRDIIGDVRPVGRGATALMAKELRAAAIDNLAQTMMDEEKDYIDFRALAKQRLLARELPVAEIMVSDDEANQRYQARQQQQATAQQQQDQMFQANLKVLLSDALKNASQAKKNADNADAAAYKAVLDALKIGANPNDVARIAHGTAPGSAADQGLPGDQAGAGAAGAGAAVGGQETAPGFGAGGDIPLPGSAQPAGLPGAIPASAT